jgi:hypothetical protein
MFSRSHEADGSYGAPRDFRRAWTAFVLLLTVAPYLVNAWLAPKGYAYTWILPPYPDDAYAYRAWARQAFDGRWLFSLKFTALPNPPSLFLPFFLAAGKLARISGVDAGLILLLLKSAGVLLFFRAFFGLLRHLKLTPRQSMAAAAMAGVSAGFGGYAALLWGRGISQFWSPSDLWLVDSNTFWSLLWNPVYPFSLALIVLAFRWLDEGLETGRPALAWRSGACACALAVVHPYPLAVLYPLLTALCVVKRPGDWPAFWLRFAAAALPGTLYVAAVALLNPLMRTHNAMGTVDAHALLSYAAGFGLPLLLIAGPPGRRREFARKYWPLYLWIGLCAAFTISPAWFRVKYIFGAHLPVCILAGAGAEPFFAGLPAGRTEKSVLAAILLALTAFTPLFHLGKSVTLVQANADDAYLLSPEMRAGLAYLEAHSARSDVVFAAPPTSAKICAYAGDTVVWGHWAQSVDYDERQAWMKKIFSESSGLSLDERRELLWGPGGVDFLFLDGSWREPFRGGTALQMLAGADKVFENSEVTIYRRGERAGRPFLNAANHSVKSRVSSGSATSRR